jgi:hypothetical protein
MAINVPADVALIQISVQLYRPGEGADLCRGSAQGLSASGPYDVDFTAATQAELSAILVELASSAMLPP